MVERYEGSFRATDRETSVRAKTAGSLTRHERSSRSLAGGVSSGLRRAARPYPLFFSHGNRSRVVDVDENEYIDYTLAWGPNILGHPPHAASDAIALQAGRGLTFGAQNDLEFQVAEQLVSAIPCAGSVCYGNSGTEIVQLALRLARAVTGRPKYLKFEGHYHGWSDSVLVSYHPTREQIANANGTPVPVGLGQLNSGSAIVAEWNDRSSVEAAFQSNYGEISAVICEPLLANSGCVPPAPGFLEFLRDVTQRQGALLIFDEVITGFRLALGGAQSYYNVTPDLATYAKAAGGGVPFAVLAGNHEVMQLIADGSVVHAGTLNGNPLALAAANATLAELARNDGAVFRELHRLGDRLRQGLERILRDAGHDVVNNGVGPVFNVSFMSKIARNYRETMEANKSLYSDLALALLDEGVLVLPDGRWYLSIAHTDEDIDRTLESVRRVTK